VVLTPDQVREWLGGPRFGRYLTAAGGDAGRALALYEWNSHMAAAALRDVGHFEVAMRNAYDAQLSARFPDWAADPSSGLFRLESGPAKDRVPQRQLNAGSVGKLSAARAGLGGRPSHGQVMAALDFGFWTQLSRRERTGTLWTPTLSRAYPAHVTRGQVHGLVDNVRKFRNRLAHNEPVFSNKTGLVKRMEETETLFRFLRTEAAEWVRQHSDVPRLIARCPVQGLMPTAGQTWPMTAAQAAAQSFPRPPGRVRPATSAGAAPDPARRPKPPGTHL